MTEHETAGAAPELLHLDPATTAVVRGVITMAELREFFDASFGALGQALAAQGIEPRSPAFALYHGLPGATVDLELGFVTDRAVEPAGEVAVGSLAGGRVARLTHLGSFEGLASSWQRLGSWIDAKGLTPATDRWETYVTKPTPDMDPNELRTDLSWPIAE